MNGEVILSICAILTLLIFAVGVVLVILNRKDLKRVVRVLGVCVFLMLMSAIYPSFAEEAYAIGLTLFESMCAMLLNANLGDLLENFNSFNVAYIGISDYAQHELGDIVFVDVDTVGEEISKNEVFGTIEAVKTVSDLMMPVSGEILEFNEALEDNAAAINSDPYGEGWIIKIKMTNPAEAEELKDAAAYSAFIGL